MHFFTDFRVGTTIMLLQKYLIHHYLSASVSPLHPIKNSRGLLLLMGHLHAWLIPNALLWAWAGRHPLPDVGPDHGLCTRVYQLNMGQGLVIATGQHQKKQYELMMLIPSVQYGEAWILQI